MIVLDTNVVSETMKPEPAPAVLKWMNDQVAETVYISSVTVAELLFGVGALPDGRRKQQLAATLKGVFNLFEDRILPFDTDAARRYADLAVALWEEMMGEVADRKLRRRLFLRLTDRLAEIYRTQVKGEEWESRLVQLSGLLQGRGVEAEVARDDAAVLPFLRQHSCPYYELAEMDRAICAS